MGRKKSVVLDSKTFDSQKAALEFFKLMLNRYLPGDKVSNSDSQHLVSLLKRHPDYTSKVGCGIKHFMVIPGDYGTQCFCVVRTDETIEDFSYIGCINQKND